MINSIPMEASIAGGRVSSIIITASGTHNGMPTVTLSGLGDRGATAAPNWLKTLRATESGGAVRS